MKENRQDENWEDEERCMHGCYPADIDTIRKLARANDLSDSDLVDSSTGGPEVAEKYIIANQPNDEPYIGADPDKSHKRVITVKGSPGNPLAVQNSIKGDIKDKGYTPYKVAETYKAATGSQLEQEMNQRARQAQQQLNQSLTGIEDLYKKKQLLEHDKRKLEQKKEHFEEQNEEALKADFVDEVDQHTGRASILQMQANNIFPSITPDFYSMESLKDLTEGHLSDLPEQEKAILRKKWRLYQKWKDKFKEGVRKKLRNIEGRLQSVRASIQQTKDFLKPYVETLRVMQGDYDKKLGTIDEHDFYIGHSSQVRLFKTILQKVVNKENGKPTHRSVVVMDTFHGILADLEAPQSSSRGNEKVKITIYEFLVCEHVYQEVFAPQITERKHEVERYIKRLIGGYDIETERKNEEKGEEDEEGYFDDLYEGMGVDKSKLKHVDKYPNIQTASDYQDYSWSLSEKIKKKFYEAMGVGGDEFYVTDEKELRTNLFGPDCPTPFYTMIKKTAGLLVWK